MSVRIPGNEETLDAQYIYENSEEAGGLPRLVDGISWPGYLRKWLYSRKVRPVALVATVEDMNTIKENWITGFNTFWNAMSSFTWSTVLTAFTKFFLSRNISDISLRETTTSVNTTSSGSLTLTCAAGHSYRVIFAGIRNDTRNPALITTYTPSGGTAAEHIRPTGTASVTDSFVGTVIPEIVMQPGDTLQIEDGNFVAADVMNKTFIYEDYTLG